MSLLRYVVLPLILMSLLMQPLTAQSVDVSVCRFKNDKPAAISLTFDDGLLDQYTVVKPLLKAYDIKATFFIVPKSANTAIERRSDPEKSQRMDWGQIKELADDGHEIGNHSMGHVHLLKKSDEILTQQIDDPIALIKQKTGYLPVSFCFPWNAYDEKVMARVKVHHINARTRQFGIGRNFKLERAENWIEKTIAQNKWSVAMLHAVIAKYHGYDALPNEEKDFVGILDLLKDNRDQLWIDTFANVSKYVALRDSVKVHWIKADKTFEIKTDLDTTIYDLPLTVKVVVDGQEKLMTVTPGESVNVH